MAIRATATATIMFGMVSIPVKFYLAAKDESVGFNMISKAGNRIKMQFVDGETAEVVEQADALKGYEFEKGRFVTFTKDELETLGLQNDKALTVAEFVPAEAIDVIQVEKVYFLGPDKGGDKSYALLSDAMKISGKVAIAQWHTKGRAHLVAIRPYKSGLIAQILFYAPEVRDFGQIEVTPFPISTAEQNLALKLLDALSNDEFDASRYEDEYAKSIKEAVNAKVAGQEITVPVSTPKTNTLDMFEALKQSLSKAPKKPAPKKGKGKKA